MNKPTSEHVDLDGHPWLSVTSKRTASGVQHFLDWMSVHGDHYTLCGALTLADVEVATDEGRPCRRCDAAAHALVRENLRYFAKHPEALSR